MLLLDDMLVRPLLLVRSIAAFFANLSLHRRALAIALLYPKFSPNLIEGRVGRELELISWPLAAYCWIALVSCSAYFHSAW